MGFSIGRFLGSVAGSIGSIVTGIPGAILGGIASGFDSPAAPAQAATIGRATLPGPITASLPPSTQFGGFPVAPTSIAPSFQTAALAPILRGAGAIATGVGIGEMIFGGNGNGKSPTSRILAKARAATGGPVTRNKIIDAAKTCGLETAASTFGLDVREVCLVVVKGRTRRRRGVSAADIRRTKRTIGFASRIRKDLKKLAK